MSNIDMVSLGNMMLAQNQIIAEMREEIDKELVRFFLFNGNDHDECHGARSFVQAFDSLDAAKEYGMSYIQNNRIRLSEWCHIARFDGESLKIITDLNIPDTEQADTDVWEWIDEDTR